MLPYMAYMDMGTALSLYLANSCIRHTIFNHIRRQRFPTSYGLTPWLQAIVKPNHRIRRSLNSQHSWIDWFQGNIYIFRKACLLPWFFTWFLPSNRPGFSTFNFQTSRKFTQAKPRIWASDQYPRLHVGLPDCEWLVSSGNFPVLVARYVEDSL